MTDGPNDRQPQGQPGEPPSITAAAGKGGAPVGTTTPVTELHGDPAEIQPSAGRLGGGLISTFVRHDTAPNLLMVIMLLIGVYSIIKLNRQFFPDFDLPNITVTVAWPGASAEDVETNILDALEPELRFLDGVDNVTSYAREGVATVLMEFETSADMQKAQSDVEQAVSRVTTFPEDAERPLVSRIARYDRVARISISGPFSEKVLKTYAKQLRDGLLNAGIDRVTLEGSRDEEVWIRLRESDLRRLGLTLADVAQRIKDNTQDSPAGRLQGQTDMQLRAKSDRKTPREIGLIEIKSTSDGRKIFLRDIAEIDTRFERDGKIGLVSGKQAVQLTVQRAITADTIKTMTAMKKYIAEIGPTLPETLQVKVYDVRAKLVEGRLFILIENGIQGLAFVLAMLFIFLNARIAFWVAMGIPVALAATLGVMLVTGQSINMVSMFALIMMLGIIVDDAIVVGEHAATLEAEGYSRRFSAETSANHMFAPVTAAMLTTTAAFLPIFFISGIMGSIMSGIPLVVIAAIIASLVEVFLVLPGHLRHGRAGHRGVSKPRAAFDRGFAWFRDNIFGRLISLAFDWRYATLALLLGAFIISVGMMAGGRLKFVFFPRLEAENISAKVVFAPGMPRPAQIAAIARIEKSLYRLEQKQLKLDRMRMNRSQPVDPPKDGAKETHYIDAVFTTLGGAGRATGDNLAQIEVQLTPSEFRTVRTKSIIEGWRRAAPKIPGVERLAIGGRRGGPPGGDVDVRLQNAPVEKLKAAAEELKDVLTGFPGVTNITDDLPYGRQELTLELTPRGTALGLTGANIGRQIRNAFEGAIATRFARGDDEITVRVMRAQELSGAADLQRLYVKTPAGKSVLLTEVVSIKERRSFSVIQRRDGLRTVSVGADIDTKQTTTPEVLARLTNEFMPQIAEKYHLTYEYKGRDEERREAFKDLKLGAMIALALIYIILAWVFASYWKPLAVMSIIPFGFVGAVGGHYIMGFPLTIISMIGLLGLSGILVNDSIVLVARVKERLSNGDDLRTAAIGAGRDRFRAVLLTSLTTIGGLLPLVFETSRQAQFLIPMAITIVFGLTISTILVLVLVPSLLGVGGDVHKVSRYLGRAVATGWRFTYGSRRPAATQTQTQPEPARTPRAGGKGHGHAPAE